MRPLAAFEICPVTIQQAIRDDGFDLAVFCGGGFIGHAFHVFAGGINIRHKRKALAIGRPDELPYTFGNISDLAEWWAIWAVEK